MSRAKFLYWSPRILGILAILFISLFSLDSFEGDSTLIQKLMAFLIHLIPSFFLSLLLAFAWKRAFAGGLILMLIGIAGSMYLFYGNYQNNHSIWISLSIVFSLGFPIILSGFLFILDHHYTRIKQS